MLLLISLPVKMSGCCWWVIIIVITWGNSAYPGEPLNICEQTYFCLNNVFRVQYVCTIIYFFVWFAWWLLLCTPSVCESLPCLCLNGNHECAQDIGAGKGKYYAVNYPLRDGIDDESYEAIFKPVSSLYFTEQPNGCSSDTQFSYFYI